MNENSQSAAIKRLFFIIIVCLQPVLVFCQKGYESGYVITNDNDTLYGQIKDRKLPPFGKIYQKIRFRDKHIFQKRYDPYQIIGYCRRGELFESLWINVTSRFFREDYISIEGTGEKFFLKVIVKGYLTYYQREIVDPESGYFDVINLYKRENEPEMVRVNQGIFGVNRKRLTSYFQDCPELAYKIASRDIKDPVTMASFYNSWKASNESDSYLDANK